MRYKHFNIDFTIPNSSQNSHHHNNDNNICASERYDYVIKIEQLTKGIPRHAIVLVVFCRNDAE